jgi:hypothetical protein
VIDFQVWCGPAMGAFNEWVKGSHLEPQENRKTVDVALNLLYGAAVIMRLAALKSQGVYLPRGCEVVKPLTREQLITRIPQ